MPTPTITIYQTWNPIRDGKVVYRKSIECPTHFGLHHLRSWGHTAIADLIENGATRIRIEYGDAPNPGVTTFTIEKNKK